MNEASMSNHEGLHRSHLIEFPEELKFNRVESGDAHAVQIIREVLRATTNKLAELRESQSEDAKKPLRARTRKMVHIGMEDEARLQGVVETIDREKQEKIEALESEALAMLEGMQFVARKQAPSEMYFSILDQLEEQLAKEVHTASSVVALSDNPVSNAQLNTARTRLATISDYRQQCMELLADRARSKKRNEH